MSQQVPNQNQPKVKVELELDQALLNFIKMFRKLSNREHIALEADLASFLAFGFGRMLRVNELKKDKSDG